MKDRKIKEVLDKQSSKIQLSEGELEKIKQETQEFVGKLEKNLKRKKIKADVFVGGSLAKETLIKKKLPDVDIFVRFSQEYDDQKISDLLEKVIQDKNKKIHGSRDYFQVKKNVIFEIVPVLKISAPTQAKNVTDLSYFHVKYIKNKIKKNKNLGKEIMLAKNFCYAQGCYGAEGYISGFSGYALELLISYYGSFLKFIKAIDKQQIILDPSKFYKNKQEVLLELNESKLSSPIIFVDPTFKERNALAALSLKTFEKFKLVCKAFIKNPSSKFFEKQDLDEKFKKYKNFKKIEIKTNRQKGDIAGGKLKKFYLFFINKIEKHYGIKVHEFYYNEDKNIGEIYLILEQKKELVFPGPEITSVENLTKFRKKHKKCFIKKGKAYAKEKTKNLGQIVKELKKNKVLKEMSITKVLVR